MDSRTFQKIKQVGKIHTRQLTSSSYTTRNCAIVAWLSAGGQQEISFCTKIGRLLRVSVFKLATVLIYLFLFQ